MSFPLNSLHLRRASRAALLLLAFGCAKKGDDATPTPPPVVVTTPTGPSQMALWLTNADGSALFRRQNVVLRFSTAATTNPLIIVDSTRTYQTMDGFGYALTGGSAAVIRDMGAGSRADLLRELFATDSTWLGVSYLRLTIGASDLSDHVFTYDDLPAGQTDAPLAQFSLGPDRTDVIPVLKQILALNPAIKILASPWTPPSWMKSNNSPIGGSLLPQYYDAYARYFVKYIQQMALEGIRIDAVTLQNEPLYGGNNPSMLMSAGEQAAFIRGYVGPAFVAAGLTTKIIAYDHNADRPDYPIEVLNDAAARPYVDGAAFHFYGGPITNLSVVHNAFPAKNVYFTEFWTQAPGSFASDLAYHVENLEIGAVRNWSRNVVEWNLANNQNYGPHTGGAGCSECLGAVTIAGSTVTRNPAYYTVGHSSKFVRPGSVRLDTNVPANLPNVAYKTPAGRKVLVVLNTSSAARPFNIQYQGRNVATSLPGGSVGTYVW